MCACTPGVLSLVGLFFSSDTALLSANPLLRGWGRGREGLKETPSPPLLEVARRGAAKVRDKHGAWTG